MKLRHIAFFLMAFALVALFSWQHKPAAAQTVISENLFQNPGWEAGYYNQDQISQIAVPNGWRMHWVDGVAFEGTDGRPAYRPETVVWNIEDAPLDERTVFFKDGIYTLKIFKSWAPMYAAISQDVTGLEVGRKYRIVAPIFVDIIEDYANGGKVPPTDPRQGFIRFGVGPTGAAWRDASQINYSPTWTAENVNPFYQYMQTYIWDFVATQPNATIFIEMGSKYPYQNNGFFLDAVGLYATDEVSGAVPAAPAAPAGGGGGGAAAPAAAPVLPTLPPPTPRADGSIVHVVGAGDTFWGIAIQYASVLGLTPEQALPAIQELNGNPAFLNAGQELLIQAAGATAAADTGTGGGAGEDADAAASTTTETITNTNTTEEATAVPETDTAVIVVEGAATAEPTATAAPAGPTGVCVTAFEDVNGNGAYETDSETLKADAAITLFKDGTTVSTYITDGLNEVHCFEQLVPGSYQVQLYPPANYVPTTADSWAVDVAEGLFIPVSFGMQLAETAPNEVADATTTEQPADSGSETAVDTTTTEETTTEEAPAEDSNGIFSSIGGIVIIVAVVLVLLAGAGVVMLRRG